MSVKQVANGDLPTMLRDRTYAMPPDLDSHQSVALLSLRDLAAEELQRLRGTNQILLDALEELAEEQSTRAQQLRQLVREARGQAWREQLAAISKAVGL